MTGPADQQLEEARDRVLIALEGLRLCAENIHAFHAREPIERCGKDVCVSALELIADLDAYVESTID